MACWNKCLLSAEHFSSLYMILTVAGFNTLSLFYQSAQVTQISGRVRIWTHIHFAPKLVAFALHWELHQGPPFSVVGFFPHSGSLSHVPVVHPLCKGPPIHIAACHHLQEPSLPLSWLKFIVYVLLSFSNWLKFTHFPRSYFKPFKTHILICRPPNKTKFIHDP